MSGVMANLPPSDGARGSGSKASVTAKMGTQTVRNTQTTPKPDYGPGLIEQARARGRADPGVRDREKWI